MAIIGKQPVTLTVDETEALLAILRDFTSERFNHAGRTKSASIRDHCRTQGHKANTLADGLIRRLYTCEPNTEPKARLVHISAHEVEAPKC